MSVNQALAERFEEIAQMIELLGQDRFRAAAHERAARALENLPADVATLVDDRKALLAIDGIGPKTADKIIEFVKTGRIAEHDELRSQVPVGLLDLLKIPNLGPKTVRVLWKERGIHDMAGLKRAIQDGSILEVPRMGAKSVERLKESIALAEEGSQRLPLGLAAPIAERFVARLSKVKGVKRVAYAGSVRRGRETIRDIDILIATTDPAAAGEAFRAMPEVRQVIAAGETKSSVRASITPDMGRWRLEGQEGQAPTGPTVQVDLRVVPLENWGAALLYFTGSKEHNIRLRERALKAHRTLNEYGLFPETPEAKASGAPPQSLGVKPVASRTEEEMYAAFGLPYLHPEIREDHGEFDAAQTPRLIEVDDIKAELHAHTTASDGKLSIEELAARAKERGFHTIAVTDHSRSSIIANGLSVDRLMEHIEAVRRADEKIKGIKVLAGSEVDIHADGSLDYDDDVLAMLDLVVASPHSALSQDPKAATERLIRAVRNPYVHILGHPTGRLINRRAGLSPDIARLAAAACEHHVALEINAHWLRLDLRDVHVRAAAGPGGGGCLIAIDCDVHIADDFDNLRYGVTTARRGWLTPDACINTWTARKLHAWLKAKRGG